MNNETRKCSRCGKTMPLGIEGHTECCEPCIQYLTEDLLRDHYPQYSIERLKFERLLGDIEVNL